jgi:gas vesicle protein
MSRNTGDFSFALGVLAGTVMGAGLVMWLAPRAAAEARRTVTDSANAFREGVTERYGETSQRLVSAVDDLAARGLGVRDGVADAVVRGARHVERVAVAVKAVPPSNQL